MPRKIITNTTPRQVRGFLWVLNNQLYRTGMMDSQHQRSPVEFNQSCLQGSILLLCRNEGIMISKSFSAMNSVIPNYCAKKLFSAYWYYFDFLSLQLPWQWYWLSCARRICLKISCILRYFQYFFLYAVCRLLLVVTKISWKARKELGIAFCWLYSAWPLLFWN